VLVVKERGKPEYPEKNLSQQGREPTTNSTHIWRRRQDSNPGHIGGRRVLSPLRHPCSPKGARVGKSKLMVHAIPFGKLQKHQFSILLVCSADLDVLCGG